MMWLVTLASLVATVANIRKIRWGFAVWAIADAAWLVYDFYIGAYEQAALFAVYTGLAIWGWLAWRVPKESK